MKNSIRLNAAIRSTLQSAVLRHKFQKEGDALFEENRRIALWAYNIKFDAETQKRFAELPDGWLKEEDSFNFSAAVGSNCYHFNGRVSCGMNHAVARKCIHHQFDEIHMRTPHCFVNPRINLPEFVLAVQKCEQRKDKLEEAMKNAFSKVNQMLNQYTTIGTLKAAWPEIEPFIPAEHKVVPPPVQLPAVRPATLNAMLDLPV